VFWHLLKYPGSCYAKYMSNKPENGKRTTVLITGHTGFIGHHLVRHIQRLDPDVRLEGFYRSSGENIRDYAPLLSRVRAVNLVINLAGTSRPDRGWSNPHETYETDALGAITIMEACKNSNVPLIHISSSEVYGTNIHQGYPMPESHPLHPKNPYGVAKKASDEAALTYIDDGVPIALLRLFTPYGTGEVDPFHHFIPRLVRQAITGGDLPVTDGGVRRRDWIFAEDIAEAIWEARNASPDVYNIARGVLYSDLEVALLVLKEVKEVFPTKSRILPLSSQTPLNDPLEQLGDPVRFFEETGWHAHTSLEEGIRQCIAFYTKTSA